MALHGYEYSYGVSNTTGPALFAENATPESNDSFSSQEGHCEKVIKNGVLYNETMFHFIVVA